jgi:hypothetical protein
MIRYSILTAGLLLAAMPALAQAEPEPPACSVPGVLPPELSAWSMLAYHDAAASPAGLAKAALTVGETARVTLLHTPAVSYRLRPEKPAAPDSYGGLLQLVVPARGTYRLVLGSRAWIDLVAPGGTPVASLAHSMGPACTGIRKMVDFTLDPGSYVVQLSGNAEPAISVLALRIG